MTPTQKRDDSLCRLRTIYKDNNPAKFSARANATCNFATTCRQFSPLILFYAFNVFQYLYVSSIVFNVGTQKALLFSNRAAHKSVNGEMLVRLPTTYHRLSIDNKIQDCLLTTSQQPAIMCPNKQGNAQQTNNAPYLAKASAN